MNNSQVQVLLLLGCQSNLSCKRMQSLLQVLKSLLHDRGAEVHTWDLYNEPVPISDITYNRGVQNHKSEVVQVLTRLANDVDAFVWCTPAYYNSFSGVLKNALDHLQISQCCQKPVAFISHDRDRSARVTSQLRAVADGLSAMPLPIPVVTVDTDFELYQGNYRLVNCDIEKRLLSMADDLVKYSRTMRRIRR